MVQNGEISETEIPRWKASINEEEDLTLEKYCACINHVDLVRYIISGYFMFTFRFLPEVEEQLFPPGNNGNSSQNSSSGISSFTRLFKRLFKLKKRKSSPNNTESRCEEQPDNVTPQPPSEIGTTELKSSQLVRRLYEIISARKTTIDSEELRTEELSVRMELLRRYKLMMASKQSLALFVKERGEYFDSLTSRVLMYIVAKAMEMSDEQLDILDKYQPFIEDFIRVLQTTTLSVLEYCMNLYETIQDVFCVMIDDSKGLMETLDCRYRHHFRASVFQAIDSACESLGTEYWTKKFPAVADSEPDPHSVKIYDLTDENCIYEWPQTTEVQLIMEPPYAPLLEYHQEAKLSVLVKAVSLLYAINAGIIQYSPEYASCLHMEDLIAIAICIPSVDFQAICVKLKIPQYYYFKSKAGATADLTCICELACRRKNQHTLVGN